MRWLALIAIVFAFHVALIFIFGARKPAVPLPVKNAPSLALVEEPADDWLTLNNATLFGLPNQAGFAGSMWTALPPLPFREQDWSEKPRWLMETDSLAVAALVRPFNRFVQTNRSADVHLEFYLPPRLMVLSLPAESPFAPASMLQIEGGLAGRRLLNPLEIPSLPSTDVLEPSVVQVLVNAAGDVVSAVLLPPENFFEATATVDSDADKRAAARALELARTARFAPLASGDGRVGANPAAGLTIGRLIFNWQTVPESGPGDANQGEL